LPVSAAWRQNNDTARRFETRTMWINIGRAHCNQANYVNENRKEAKQANDVQYMSVAESG